MGKNSNNHEQKADNKAEKHDAARSDDAKEDVNLDFSGVKKFFSNNKLVSTLVLILLILIPVLLTVYIRLQPEYLPQTDVWAESSVNNYFKSQISASVNQQYPNLPQANKDALVNQQFADFVSKNKDQIAQQIKGTSDFFKTGFRYEENNHTYTFLGDLDSYYYLRFARNLEEKGMVCDEIKDGVCWDNHIIAPIGGALTSTMHPLGITYFHKFLNLFDSSINLMQAAFLLPTLLAAIAAIAAFFIGRKVMNNTAGFFAAMFVALSPMFISRTLGSDTDIWNVMFPLIIVWVFLEAFEAKSLLKKGILSGVIGLLMGIFSFAWGSGWWYIFDFIIATVIGYILFLMIKTIVVHKTVKKVFSKEVLSTLMILGIIVVASGIFVTLFTSFSTFQQTVTAPFSLSSGLKVAAHENLWPNVYTTVAELNEADIPTIISQTAFGLKALFALALLGIIFTMMKKKPDFKEYVLIVVSALLFFFLVSNAGTAISTYLYLIVLMLPLAAALIMALFDKNDSGIDIKPAILLTIWFVGMIFASIKGVRFILLLIPAFSVAIGIAIGYLWQYISRLSKEELKIPEVVSQIAVFVILCLLLLAPFNAGLSTGKNFTPSMTKGWWDSLIKVRDESKPDAVINSWWDFGHWFKYVADRRVTLDGANQNHPNAHWLGRILQTDNEAEAVAILRMVDCGSNNAFEEINKKYQDTEVSQNLLKELILLDKTKAESFLMQKGFSNAETQTILKLTHCEPPEDYFITSEDMVGKAGVWAHFGLWDFDKAFIINNLRNKDYGEAIKVMKQRWNFTEEKASATYYEVQSLNTDREMNDWISPWPNYFTTSWLSCKVTITQPNATIVDNKTVISGKPEKVLGCPVGRVINQDQSGMQTAIDGLIFNFDNHAQSGLLVGSYDSTGYRRGSGKAVPSAFVLYTNDSVQRIPMENVTFPYDVVIDVENNKSMIVDPLLSQSMFTKLFYLDGKATSHFEKFSDMTDITGSRIIVWKVKWD